MSKSAKQIATKLETILVWTYCIGQFKYSTNLTTKWRALVIKSVDGVAMGNAMGLFIFARFEDSCMFWPTSFFLHFIPYKTRAEQCGCSRAGSGACAFAHRARCRKLRRGRRLALFYYTPPTPPTPPPPPPRPSSRKDMPCRAWANTSRRTRWCHYLQPEGPLYHGVNTG